MERVIQFNNFATSFKELEKNKKRRFFIQYFHSGLPSEPVISVLDNVKELELQEDEGKRNITIRTLSDNTEINFNESLYNTEIMNSFVVFRSKSDEYTFCLINFDK